MRQTLSSILVFNQLLPLALTNAGATIADIWSSRERGTAAAIYAAVPFLGPSKPIPRVLSLFDSVHQ